MKYRAERQTIISGYSTDIEERALERDRIRKVLAMPSAPRRIQPTFMQRMMKKIAKKA